MPPVYFTHITLYLIWLKIVIVLDKLDFDEYNNLLNILNLFLSQYNSLCKLVVNRNPRLLQELLPDGPDWDDINDEPPVPDILGGVHWGLVLRLDEDGEIVGEEDVEFFIM